MSSVATRMFHLFTITLLCSLGGSLAATPTLWNEQIDFLLMWFDYGSAHGNLTTVSIPDLVTDKIQIRDAKLANIASLTRASDVFMVEPQVDDMKIYGSFSLGKFKLYVNDFRYKNFAGPATFTAAKNSVKIAYTLKHHTKPGRCVMDWEVFELAPFQNVIMYSDNQSFNKKVITEEVNKNILPELNKYMSSAEYQKTLNHVLDFCFINIFK